MKKDNLRNRQKEKWKEDKPGNRQIRQVSMFFSLVLILFFAYFIWFQESESEAIINNPYNKRVEAMASRITRGKILTEDGTVIAQTITDEQGEEIRYYPYGNLLAFVTGYTDRGKTGVESIANYYLLTSHQNALAKLINDIRQRKDTGDSVVTTIDLDLQLAAEAAMDGRKGAVIVLQASTGKILAMVSNPCFDPNTIEQDWDSLISGDNKEANLLNRVSQGLYPPGSTFKLLTLLEFIREYPDTWQDFHYTCNGVNREDGYTIRCFGGGAHGEQDVETALVNSCNGAFAAIGQLLDPVQFTQTCTDLGLNTDMDLDVRARASSFSLDAGSNPWTIARTAIGQGQTQITPLLSAMITAAIANGGTMIKPYLVDRVVCGEKMIRAFAAEGSEMVMTAQETQTLREMMRSVITDGTAHSLQTDLYEASGKTGTAEYITGSDNTHAWFTGFAGTGDDCIAVSVILEGGGTGSSKAAPVAAAIFEQYFD